MITAGGGFELPLRYTDTREEYFAVRRRVGINDLSHMGEIDIKGRDAFRLVQKLGS
jgi:aminomethyltransferase